MKKIGLFVLIYFFCSPAGIFARTGIFAEEISAAPMTAQAHEAGQTAKRADAAALAETARAWLARKGVTTTTPSNVHSAGIKTVPSLTRPFLQIEAQKAAFRRNNMAASKVLAQTENYDKYTPQQQETLLGTVKKIIDDWREWADYYRSNINNPPKESLVAVRFDTGYLKNVTAYYNKPGALDRSAGEREYRLSAGGGGYRRGKGDEPPLHRPEEIL